MNSNLRILIHKRPNSGAGRTIHEGYKDAIELGLGGQCYELDSESENIEDVFNSFKPIIYIADCRRRFEVPKYLNERQCKIIMGVDQLPGNGENPLCNSLAEQGYIADKDQIAWVNQVKPDVLFSCASQHAVDIGWRGWQQLGFNVISVPLAGNPFRFYDNGTAFDIRSIDVGYIGGFWPYKAPGLFSYIMPALTYCKVKVVGEGWPLTVVSPFYNSKACCDFWNDTKIAPAVHEPNVRYNPNGFKGGELAERVYNTALCGCFVISDCPDSLEQILGDDAKYFPASYSIDEFHYLVRQALENPEESTIKMRNQSAVIRSGHTYNHRILKIIKALGCEEYY
jgi:hypothetical protein